MRQPLSQLPNIIEDILSDDSKRHFKGVSELRNIEAVKAIVDCEVLLPRLAEFLLNANMALQVYTINMANNYSS